jgi:xylulokinase
MSDVVIGVDVGSSGTCAQAIDSAGSLLASAYRSYDVSYVQPGWADQDPEAWMKAVVETVSEARAAVAGRRISAIGFGSQLDGLVALDGAGKALRSALIWMDKRAGHECDELAKRLDAGWLRKTSGCNLDAGHVAAKIVWLQRNEPDVFAATRSFALPGSYVALRVSGVHAVDPSNASSTMLLDVRSRAWSSELCAAFGIDLERLPPVQEASTVLGPPHAWFRDATGLDSSTEVVLGCGDEMAATLGAGVIDAGTVCDVLGTAEPVCAVTERPVNDESGVVEAHPHADPDKWLLENPGWLSGGAYRWFRDELARGMSSADRDQKVSYEALNELIAESPAGADGVIWLPFLGGATAPEWNSSARAVWFGLTAAHGRSHLVRALHEGNAFALRDVLQEMRSAGATPKRIICVGGGARSKVLRSIRADVTGLPVSRSEDVETTARGAAILAALGAGLHPSVASACAAMASPAVDEIQPDESRHLLYVQVHARYRELYAALKPLFTKI